MLQSTVFSWIALASMVAGSSASAAVISFEAGGAGQAAGSGTIVNTSAPDPSGITDGSQAARLDFAASTSGGTKFADGLFRDNNDGVSADPAFVSPAQITADAFFSGVITNGGFLKLELQFFIPNVSTGGNLTPSVPQGNEISIGANTIVFDLTPTQVTAVQNANAADGLIKLDIKTSKDNGSTTLTAGTLTVDNVQLIAVPEPASLSLAGLGGLLLLRRTRRLF